MWLGISILTEHISALAFPDARSLRPSLHITTQVVVLVTTFFYTIPKLEPGHEPTVDTWVYVPEGVTYSVIPS